MLQNTSIRERSWTGSGAGCAANVRTRRAPLLGTETLNAIILAALLAVPTFAADPTLRPALSWSKTFGGSGNDVAMAVATDAAGNAYFAGYTTSPDFPVQNGVQMRMGGKPLRASTD